jgi:hypothetical protein
LTATPGSAIRASGTTDAAVARGRSVTLVGPIR